MRHICILSAVVLSTAATASLAAQATPTVPAGLRPGTSSRATAEVTLAVPRPASAMPAMGGMGATSAAPASAPAPAPATAAAPTTPAAKPLVIRLDYGQPHLRGRTLHIDSLVPYDKPWRTGANGSTTLTTDVDLVLGGTTLPKGSYVLYTLPGRTTWKLIIQRSVRQSAMTYSDSNDVARIDLRHSTLSSPLESLTMWLIPSLQPGIARGELRFAWGNDQLSTDWSVKQ